MLIKILFNNQGECVHVVRANRPVITVQVISLSLSNESMQERKSQENSHQYKITGKKDTTKKAIKGILHTCGIQKLYKQ